MTGDTSPPDRDWPDDYATAAYRGPQPWPVPAGWVLSLVEADGTSWYRFPGIGEGMKRDDEIHDIYGADLDAFEDAREEYAALVNDPLEIDARAGTETVKHTLKIDGEVVFERVDPEWDDLLATTAEALARYANGQDLEELAPTTGRPPSEDGDTEPSTRGDDSVSLEEYT